MHFKAVYLPATVFPSVLLRLGHTYLLSNQLAEASEAFLLSVREGQSFAETWVGLAFAAYRADDVAGAYEALREANWLDDSRPDVWGFLTLVHLRLNNMTSADNCFRQCMRHVPSAVGGAGARYNTDPLQDTMTLEGADAPMGGEDSSVNMSDELLLEIGLEFLKHPKERASAVRAEAAARKAMELRETGQAHEVLADALAAQELLERAVLELGIAIRLFFDQPRHREALVAKAISITDAMEDPPLAESIHIAQKLAQAKFEKLVQN